jgi:TP901 family phage tail tape measure protein
MLKLQATTIGLNKNLTNQVGVMNRQFDETMRSTGQFSRHFVTLTSDVSKFGQNLDSGRMKLGQYFQTWQGHTRKTSSLVKDLAKQQVMLENAVVQPLGKNAQGLMQYNVMVQSGLDATKNKTALMRQELSIMNKVMNDGANQLINWGKNTQWAGRQLTVGLTVPLAAFGMAAAKAFRQADEELVRLTKVYGGLTATSTADLLQIRKDVSAVAKELASGLGANFTETIALAADIAATGKQGTELIESTRQTTRLAILGEVDRQDAMKATLAIQTAFGQNTMELAESIDFLNAVENQTSTTLEDLVTAIPKAGPVVKALGGDVQDLALYLTAMREGGINASEGANALKSALASIINPTKVAKEMFNGLGIDLAGIVDKNAGNLTGTVMALKDSLDSLEPLQRARAIEQLFGKFQFARINALFENLGKQGSQTLSVLDLMKASTKDLANISDRELTALTESASGKYRRALESVKADLAIVGEQFLKVGAFVLNAIDGILKFIGNLPGPIKAVLGFIGGLTAIAGPIIMLTGVLANFFGYIVKGIFALKNIGKGGTGFKLLTPELMAASNAAKTVETSFYSDTKAAATFSDAVLTLASSFDKLKQSAMSSTIATSNSMSTVAGNRVTSMGGRIVDKNNPLVGKPYSRDMSHMIPTGSKTPEQRASETIFSTAPGPKPVNQRISNAPQLYMNNDMAKIPGLTSINGVSTGVVAAEAAKWHSMTAAIAMQSKAELAVLKTEIAATGTVTASLADSYQALLPQMTKITSLAADETALIVKQLQAGKLTVEAARAKIFALNAQVEAMMVQTAQGVATAQARNISLTTVPLTTQPVVSAAGKSNMKELFHKTETSKLVDSIARGLGVRTSGAGYSIQTTKPRFNTGGQVESFNANKTQVTGPASISYDDRMGSVPVGGYVLNQDASIDPRNAPLVEAAASTYNGGGEITALLTPKETVFGAGIQDNPELLKAVDAANNGTPLTKHAAGGQISFSRASYGVMNPKVVGRLISQMFRKNPKLSRQLAQGRDLRLTAEEAAAYQSATFGSAMRSTRLGADGSYFYVGNWGGRLRSSVNTALAHGAAKKADVVADLMSGSATQALPSLTRFLQVNKVSPERISQLTERARTNIVSKLGGTGKIGEAEWSKVQHAEYLSISKELRLKKQYLESLNVPGQRRKHSSNPAAHGFAAETALNPYNTKDLNRLMAQNDANSTSYMGSYRSYGIEKINGEATALAHMMPGYALGGMISDSDLSQVIANKGGKVVSLPSQNGKYNVGGMISSGQRNYGNLPQKTLDRLTAKWPPTRQFYKPGFQYVLGNQDPLHGPLQIGMSQSLKRYAGYKKDDYASRRDVVFKDERFSRLNIMPGFLTGTPQERGKYATAQYMDGNLDIMSQMERLGNHPLGPIAAMKTVQKKFTGKLFRGLKIDKTFKGLPQDLIDAIRVARATGDASGLIGKEFIMRRSSWSKSPTIASFFAPGSKVSPDSLVIEAAVKNRNILPAGDMFPDKKFMAPYGQDWSGGKFGGQYKSEKEAIFGGKFKVVGFEKGRLKVETVIDGAREMGGPVNSGRPYLVGENGPEVFVPKNAGGIIPNYAVGGMIQKGKTSYGITGSKSTIVGNGGGRTNAYGVEGTLPYAPGLTIGHDTMKKTKAAMLLASKQIEMSLYALGTSVKKDAMTAARTLKYSGDQLVVGARMLPDQIKTSIDPISNSIRSIGTRIANVTRETAAQLNNVRKSFFSPQIIAPRPPGALMNPDRTFMQNSRQSFAANAKYSTTAMLNPIQYGRSVLNRPVDPNKPRGQGMVTGMVGYGAGTAIGSKLGGQTGGFVGGMVGMVAAPMIAAKAGAAFAGLSASMGGAGFAATAVAAAGLVAPIAAVTAAVAGGVIAFKHYKKGQELNISTFGLTAESAKKAGLRYTDFGARIKDAIQDSKDLTSANKLVYASMKDGGTPFQMTIAEYKKLKVEVKETFSDQIKALDRQPSNKVPEAVKRIKEQLIAAGMSADEATKKVYTMLKLSNKKDQSITATMGNAEFRKISDPQSAAVSSVDSFGKSTRNEGRKERAVALNTALVATETGINDLIAKRERLVAKDLTGKTQSLSYAEAEKIMIDKLNQSKEATTKITAETVAELTKTNPQIKQMINGSDTVVSVFQKIRLEAQGFNGDLSKLNSTQAGILSQAFSAISSSVQSTNRTGMLKDQYSNLEKLDKQIKAYTKSLKGQSVAAQISDRDRSAALNKQIEANNKLAEARKKALQVAQQDADLGRQIEKTRLEMQNAAATGDTGRAQELRIDLESLTSQQQTEAQTRAIDTANEAANKPLKAALEALSEKQKKLADSAALAGESLDKIQDKYTKQQAAIDKVNVAMTTLYGNAAAAGKTIEQYVKTTKGGLEAAGLVEASESATSKKMDRYKTTSAYEGGTLVTKKVPVSPEQNAVSLLAKSGATAGVNEALAASIKGGKTLADVVNAVKGIDPLAAKRKDIAVTGDYSNKMESKTFDGKKVNVLNAQARDAIANREGLQIGETFIWNGQRYGKSKKDSNVVFMGKAATGVEGGGKGMYLVGENGPEMVHLKNRANIMPNDVINTLASASPRYNFNRAQYNLKDAAASGNSYVVNQTIYASEGMDVEALSNMIVRKAEVVIGQKAKINVKMVGQGKSI